MSLSYLIDRRLTRRVGTRWTCSPRVKAKRLRYRDCREMSSVGETGGYAAWFEWFDRLSGSTSGSQESKNGSIGGSLGIVLKREYMIPDTLVIERRMAIATLNMHRLQANVGGKGWRLQLGNKHIQKIRRKKERNNKALI